MGVAVSVSSKDVMVGVPVLMPPSSLDKVLLLCAEAEMLEVGLERVLPVGATEEDVIGAVLELRVTVFWKQEQALLTLIVAKRLTKLGRAVEAPAGNAKRPGQKVSASGVKIFKALRTSSS